MKGLMWLCMAIFVVDAKQTSRNDFDFTVGEWSGTESAFVKNEFVEFGKVKLSVVKSRDNLTFFEQMTFHRSNGDIHNSLVRYYDTPTKAWKLHSISFAGSQIWEGRQLNGLWYFYDTTSLPSSRIMRIHWDLDSGRMVEYDEVSTDQGKTWSPHVIFRYEKVK